MRKPWRWIGSTAALLVALVLVSELHGASTWRMKVAGNPGTGDLVYGLDANNLTSLASVAAGSVLTSNGAGAAPVWSTAPAFLSPTTATTAQFVTLTSASSGGKFIGMKSTTQQVFTLPSAATAGLDFCFTAGDANGDILIDTVGGNTLTGKTHAAENGAAIASTNGIMNTAATNVAGDHVCVVSNGSTGWYMYSVAGVWAAIGT